MNPVDRLKGAQSKGMVWGILAAVATAGAIFYWPQIKAKFGTGSEGTA